MFGRQETTREMWASLDVIEVEEQGLCFVLFTANTPRYRTVILVFAPQCMSHREVRKTRMTARKVRRVERQRKPHG